MGIRGYYSAVLEVVEIVHHDGQCLRSYETGTGIRRIPDEGNYFYSPVERYPDSKARILL
jgi:hypothetical protein